MTMTNDKPCEVRPGSELPCCAEKMFTESVTSVDWRENYSYNLLLTMRYGNWCYN